MCQLCLVGTIRVVINGSFSDILIVLKDSRFKSCERIYIIDFLFFSKSNL